MHEYEKIRLMLSAAEQLYDDGEISREECLVLLEEIQVYFKSVQKKIQEEEIKEILNKYLTDLP